MDNELCADKTIPTKTFFKVNLRCSLPTCYISNIQTIKRQDVNIKFGDLVFHCHGNRNYLMHCSIKSLPLCKTDKGGKSLSLRHKDEKNKGSIKKTVVFCP